MTKPRKSRKGKDRYFELEVRLPGQGPMRTLIKAATAREAFRAALGKYPGGTVVEVEEHRQRLSPLNISSYDLSRRNITAAHRETFVPPSGAKAFENLQTHF